MAYRRDHRLREVYEQQILGRSQAKYQRMERQHQFDRPEGERETYSRGGGRYPGDKQRGNRGERVQYSGDKRPPYRRDEPYFYYRGSAEEPTAARQPEHRNSDRVTSQVSVRSQRLPPPRPLMSMPLRVEDGIVHGNPDQGGKRESLKRKTAFSPAREKSPPKKKVPPASHKLSSHSYSPECSTTNHPQPVQPKKTSFQSDEGRPPSYHSGDSQDESPHSSTLAAKDKLVGAGVEQGEETNVKEDAGLTVEARRAHAIANKALEIEKLYRQDCETFGMVVKMLVAKQPNLESRLQPALKQNLTEIKQRCLEDLRHFISEVNVVLKPDQH